MTRVMLAMLLGTSLTLADAGGSREAGKHFQRGVDLYNDGDFRGALVEFKKAYDTWPRANVLYDIGQTQFQLMDYAGALATMTRYLAETGPTAAHRAEVEATVDTLRGRVGRISLAVELAGCEVSIDDQASGATPLISPLVVSVGLRKLSLACPGRPTVAKQVEVAAGERVELELKVPPPLVTARAPAPHVEARPSRAGYVVGWTVFGVLFAASVATGITALADNQRLSALKQDYPVSRATLDQGQRVVSGLAIATDVVGACALLVAGVSTYLTVKYKRETRPRRVSWNGAGVTF